MRPGRGHGTDRCGSRDLACDDSNLRLGYRPSSVTGDDGRGGSASVRSRANRGEIVASLGGRCLEAKPAGILGDVRRPVLVDTEDRARGSSLSQG
jgi:hypothetical protein